MKVVVFSSDKSNENELQLTVKMFELGLEVLHLRKQSWSKKKYKQFFEALPEKYHNRVVLHSRHMLALKYDVKGIYLTRKHRKRPWRTKLRIKFLKHFRKNLSVISSFHDLRKLNETHYPYDYVFLSPVFNSISKQGHNRAFGKEKLEEKLKDSKIELYALGGVDVEQVGLAQELGFKGVAILGAIWHSNDPLQKFKEIQKAAAQLKMNIKKITYNG